MKSWKRVASMLMALTMTGSFAACGGMGGTSTGGGQSTGGDQSTGGGQSTGGTFGDVDLGGIVDDITGGIEDVVNSELSAMAQKYKSAIGATVADTKAVKLNFDMQLTKNPFDDALGEVTMEFVLSEAEQGMALSIYGCADSTESNVRSTEYIRVIMMDGYIYTKNWDNETYPDGTVDTEENATWYRGEMPQELAMIMSGQLQEQLEQMLGGGAEAVNEEMGGEVIEGEMGGAEMGGASSMSQLIMMAIQTKEAQAAFEFLGKAFEYGYGEVVDAGVVNGNAWTFTTDFKPVYDFVDGFFDGINPETMTFAQYEEYVLKTMGINVSFDTLMSEAATLLSKKVPYALDMLNSFTQEAFDMSVQEFKDSAVDAIVESEIGQLMMQAMFAGDMEMAEEQFQMIKDFQVDTIFDSMPEVKDMTFKDFINMMVTANQSQPDYNYPEGDYNEPIYPEDGEDGKVEEKVETTSAEMEEEPVDFVGQYFEMLNQMKDMTLVEMGFEKPELPIAAVREAKIVNTITLSEDESKVVGASMQVAIDVDAVNYVWDDETQESVKTVGALAMSAEISVAEFYTVAQAIVAPTEFVEVENGGNSGGSGEIYEPNYGMTYEEFVEAFNLGTNYSFSAALMYEGQGVEYWQQNRQEDIVQTILNIVDAEGNVVDYVENYIERNGETVYYYTPSYDEDGNLKGYTKEVRDRLFEELENEELYTLLSEAMRDMNMYTYNPETGMYYANQIDVSGNLRAVKVAIRFDGGRIASCSYIMMVATEDGEIAVPVSIEIIYGEAQVGAPENLL